MLQTAVLVVKYVEELLSEEELNLGGLFKREKEIKSERVRKVHTM